MADPCCACCPLQCGCQCTQCCFNGDANNCTRMEMTPCPYECKAYNRSACGIQFSKPRQAPFCAIPHTSSWPAILQVGPAAAAAAAAAVLW
jgi:hypothetical protein